jgi:arabinose-5-phosphate isomerase
MKYQPQENVYYWSQNQEIKMNYKDIAQEVFDIEIAGLNYVKNNLNGDFSDAVDAILKSSGRLVVTGMGKSGQVGKKIAATLASTGTKSFYIHPGEAYHGDLGMIDPSDVVLAISNSGETEEIVRLMSFFKDNGNLVIGMTGNPESTLAVHADFFLNISIEKEACPLALAPTTSTTVTMALGDALAVALMKARDFRPEHFAKFHPGGSLGRKLLTTVSDVMKTDNLPVLNPDDTFAVFVEKISGGLLGIGVIVENDEIVGVVTDGDIRRAIQTHGEKILNFKASDISTPNPMCVDINLKIVEAEKIMQDKKVTALLATEGNSLRGILHLYDL